MNKDRIQNLAFILLSVVLSGIILFFFANKLIPVFAPFLIAWGVAFAVRPSAKRLSEKTHIPESVLRVFIAVFVTLFAFAVLALIIWQSSAMLWRFLADVGEGERTFPFLDALMSPSLPLLGDIFPEELSDRLSEALSSVVETILRNLGSAVTSWVGLIPGALLFLLVTLISLVYFCLDLERINSAVKKILPKELSRRLSAFRAATFSVTAKYLCSYLIILGITFLVMLIGFLILGIQGAPLVALLVALLDILPIIGVGTVLVPWSIFEFAVGNVTRGIGLLLLFLANTTVRQFSEPRIVGKSIDLHPALTLILIYSGYALFGVVGIALVPIFSVMIGILFKDNGATKIDEGLVGKREDI